MISVNSLQILLLPVGLILAGHYYLEYLVDIEHLITIPTNQSLPDQLVGKWTPNDILSSAESLSEKTDFKLNGVESAAEFKGKLYGADVQNRVFEFDLSSKSVRFLTIAESRILAVRVDSKGRLFYLQPNKGIYSISVIDKNAKPQIVYEHDAVSEAGNDRNVTFLDDFAFIERENGKHLFFISQGSRRWTLDEILSQVLENENSGRVIEFDSESNKVSSLAEKLHFPNGVELLADNSAIVVAEFNQRQVVRIELKGAKRGQVKTILNNLPGEPDNIRRSKSNTFLVALTSARTSSDCHLLDRYPYSVFVRQVLLYLHRSIEVGLERIVSRFTDVSSYKQSWIDYATHSTLKYMKVGAAVEMNADGDLINVFLSQNGNVKYLSQMSELTSDRKDKRLFFLGSYIDRPASKVYV